MKSLIFIPDISGFTSFVQTTEVAHSQHIIAELLELLIDANEIDLELAEIEGDALFFYIEEKTPSQEKLLSQIETMFTVFHNHLSKLKHDRICQCNACATAPDLRLKIITHCGELQFIKIKKSRKPFGNQVIEAHRLLKNSINSDNYVLISDALCNSVGLTTEYKSKLFNFQSGEDIYDDRKIDYLFSEINTENLKTKKEKKRKMIEFSSPPNLEFEKDFPIPASTLIEYISNYKYRHNWVEGVDKYIFNENEITRNGTEHTCVINKKKLNFTTITKPVKPGQLIYGEVINSNIPVSKLYQFYTITRISKNSCRLKQELYWEVKSLFQKLVAFYILKKSLKKSIEKNLNNLYTFSNKNVY